MSSSALDFWTNASEMSNILISSGENIASVNYTLYSSNERIVASVSQISGVLSLALWLFAQLPQVIENHLNESVAGVSIWFLGCWIAGDVTNLIGCILTKALPFQTCLASYYGFIDIILSTQYWYYTRIYPKQKVHHNLLQSPNMIKPHSPHHLTHHHANPHLVINDVHDYNLEDFNVAGRQSRKDSFLHKIFSGSVVASLAKPSNAMPIANKAESSKTGTVITSILSFFGAINSIITSNRYIIGRSSAWICLALYLCSRSPQILKNYHNKSTKGMTVLLFLFAMLGNLFYTMSILCDLYLLYRHQDSSNLFIDVFWAQLPFIVGSSGTLIFDSIIIFQFWYYKDPVNNLNDGFFDHDLHMQREQQKLKRRQFNQEPNTNYPNSIFDNDSDDSGSFYTNHYNTYSHSNNQRLPQSLRSDENINTSYEPTRYNESSSLLNHNDRSRIGYTMSPPPPNYISTSACTPDYNNNGNTRSFISNTITALAKSLSRSNSHMHLRSPLQSSSHSGSMATNGAVFHGSMGNPHSSAIAIADNSLDTSLIPSIVGNHSSISKKMMNESKIPFSPIDFLHDDFHQPVSYAGSYSRQSQRGPSLLSGQSMNGHKRAHSHNDNLI